MTPENDYLEILDGLIAKARTAGADGADAIILKGTSLSVTQRLGQREHLERSESADLGLRVLVGKRQAIVSSSDLSQDAVDELVERALSMARAVPEDPYCGLAEPGMLATRFPDLDLFDAKEPGEEELAERAAKAEDAARSVAGITNSEGAEAGWSRTTVALAASNGFAQTYSVSSNHLFASVLAGQGTEMERDYDFDSAIHSGDLRPPEEIGREAGERTVRRLNPRKGQTTQVPVIFEPRVSRSLLGHLAGAINGPSVAKGTTFLKDKLGKRIFPQSVTLIDDPHRRRGLKSKPFDGEGLAAEKRAIIENGELKTWIMDLASARQLGMQSTGHARRGVSSPPSPGASNLFMEPGDISPEDMISGIKSGFYVTELIGFGVNSVTGDYSRGAGGLWIEDGEIAYSVSGVTIAGNLNDIFMNLTAADDLEFRFGTDAPTLMIEGLTVAGK